MYTARPSTVCSVQAVKTTDSVASPLPPFLPTLEISMGFCKYSRERERERERERKTYSSSQHVVGQGPETPPVDTLSVASLLEDLRCPVCVGDREVCKGVILFVGGDRLTHLISTLHDVYRLL